jgi:hypothetical protein
MLKKRILEWQIANGKSLLSSRTIPGRNRIRADPGTQELKEPGRRSRRPRGSPRRNGDNGDGTERPGWFLTRGPARAARSAAGAGTRYRITSKKSRSLAYDPAPRSRPSARLRRARELRSDGHLAVFSVRPPLTPFLRCELRSLCPLHHHQSTSCPISAASPSSGEQEIFKPCDLLIF